MPTPTKGPRLGGGPAHERLLLANLATALFEHGRITTTQAKAKRLRPLAERLITFAKRGDLPARRRVLTVVRDKGVVHALFAEIGPRFANRPGGYTRITKVGPRKGDNAPMAVIELVEALTVQQQAVGEAEAATARSARGNTDAGAAAPTGTEQASGEEVVTGSEVTVDEQLGSAEGADTGDTADTADDQQVAAEDPAEGSTSPQTESAGSTSQAEGETDKA